MQFAFVIQRFQSLIRQALYIHRVARSKVRHCRHYRRCAVCRITALEEYSVFYHRCAASGTNRRFDYLFRLRGMLGYTRNFGNNVVTAPYKYATAYSYILTSYFAYIGKRSPLHRYPRKVYRLENCQRIEFACTRYLPYYVFKHSGRFLRGKFERNRPFRKLFRISHTLSYNSIVNLDYRSVNEKIERISFILYAVESRYKLVFVGIKHKLFTRLEFVFLEKSYHLATRRKSLFDIIHIVANYL